MIQKDKMLIVKDNALIDASFNLSLTEQRVILLAIYEARKLKDVTSETYLIVDAQTYASEFNIQVSEAYKILKNIETTLFESRFYYTIEVNGEIIPMKGRWVTSAGYARKQGHIVFKLSSEFLELITELENKFTKYYIEAVSTFKSKYSLRLYEITLKWLNNNITQKYTIQEIREKLGVEPTKYKTMSLFKKNVLDKAMNEINESSDIKLSLIQEKEGNMIKSIQFVVDRKPEYSKVREKTVFQMSDKQRRYFAQLLANDEVFQSEFIAAVGQSMEQYVQEIYERLKDPVMIEQWFFHLKRHNFTQSFIKSSIK